MKKYYIKPNFLGWAFVFEKVRSPPGVWEFIEDYRLQIKDFRLQIARKRLAHRFTQIKEIITKWADGLKV